MKETDWKLHASKTPVRKLKPLRNCTALGSEIGVQQEERAERFPPQNSSSWTLCWSSGRAPRVQTPGALLPTRKHAATSPQF